MLIGLYQHRHTVASMGALALSGLRKKQAQPLSVGRVEGNVPAYDPALGSEFLRVTRGEWTGYVPPTFYVTWAMAALADALVKIGLPYAYSRVLHAASEVHYQRPLRPDEQAFYEVHVAHVDDAERRARIRVEGTVRDRAGAEIFRQAMELHVPKKSKSTPGPKREGPRVAADMHALADFRLPKRIGARYAAVSGDFNPVHWSATAARLLGFKRSFVQGYCTKAMIAHALIHHLLAGAQEHFTSLRVEFRKPILLPGEVTLFVGAEGTERQLAVGKAPGGEAFVTGAFVYRTARR